MAAVAITADRDQELVRRALEEHVLAYLVKPVEAHQLGPALQVAWARFDELRKLTSENASLRQNLAKPQDHRAGQGRADEAAPLDRGRGLPPPPARGHEPAHAHDRPGPGRPQRRSHRFVTRRKAEG